ncbi:hypothetical protein ACI3QN_04775 [Propionibacterium freudenreichii]|uniref:hypothetical protein n=1 Tax=Propionibacterium freudenreichii TaxID=1744 RepID=UPI0038526A3B
MPRASELVRGICAGRSLRGPTHILCAGDRPATTRGSGARRPVGDYLVMAAAISSKTSM